MTSKKIYMYFHAGSKNHGCEAILRATSAYLTGENILISSSPEEDIEYKVNDIITVKGKEKVTYNFFEKVFLVLTRKNINNEKYGYSIRAKKESLVFSNNSIALSIGGDNYCYGKAYNYYLAGLNKWIQKRNVKTVLWGCSIEPSTVTEDMKKDFARYDLITARESISYKFLKKYNPNTIQVSDPAFLLEKEELPLPKNFIEGKTVGINLSPLIQKSEKIEGITLENYRQLIQYILENTEYNIALIPHVVAFGNDDREPLLNLYDNFKKSNRICMIDDCNCLQLKGYISRCYMFIGARTHATIAAYSTYVPTLVIGYSTKAKGIAKDLFGSEENYVLPVQSLIQKDDMIKAFKWLDKNHSDIKKQLYKVVPEHIQRAKKAFECLEKL